MLGIESVGQLASLLETTPRCLYQTADGAAGDIQLYELVDPTKTTPKKRIVVCPKGRLRHFQSLLLKKVFRPALKPTKYSFGGVARRNARQNAAQHLSSRFAYTTDIKSFFPSISRWRVADTFESHLGCSGDVASLLTRLCTYQEHLSQGLMTSPILADQILRRTDFRIAGLCRKHGLCYSRFVDDITVSGPFGLDLTESGIVQLIRRIIRESGFNVSAEKEQSGRVQSGEVTITGLRVLNGHLDPAEEYVRRVDEQLSQHHSLGVDGPFTGLLATCDQLKGRIEYICGINLHRKRSLRQRFAAIDWQGVMRNAEVRGLIVSRKSLTPLPSGAAGVIAL